MLDFLKGIIIFIATITLPISGLFVHSKPVVKPTLTPTPTISVSISPTPKISPSTQAKESISVSPIPTQYVIISTPTPLPPTNTTQDTKMDTAMRIELCRANAEQQRINYVQAGDNLLVQERPEIVELANTSNTQQTEDIALKYGTIQQSQVVHVADAYQKLVDGGMSQSNATDMATFYTKKWWEYLQSLHDWAVKEKNDYKATIETKANNSKNEYYTKCLNYEN